MSAEKEPLLFRESQPEGFDPRGFEAAIVRRMGEDPKRTRLIDNFLFSGLYDTQVGVFGDRPGNRHRVRIRRLIERYIRIRDKRGQIVPFILNNSQRRLLSEILRMIRAGVPVRIIILKARQQGFSTLIAALGLVVWLCSRQSRCFIITHKRSISKVIFEKVELMLRGMPKSAELAWQFHLDNWTQEKMVLGEPVFSSYFIESAEANEPLRGETPNFLHLSENPSWKRADDVAQAVLSALPSTPNSFAFNEATAKGDSNMFAKEFRTAWKGNRFGTPIRLGWRAVFFPWFFDQEYRWSSIMGKPLPEKERARIENTLDNDERVLLESRYFRRGHGWVTVDYDQLAWRRFAIANICRNDLNRFHEEFPATPDEAFIASGQRLFDPLQLSRVRLQHVREPAFRGELVDPAKEEVLIRVPTTVSEEFGQQEEDAAW